MKNLFFVLIASLALAACGGEATTTTTPQDTTNTPEAAPAPTPKQMIVGSYKLADLGMDLSEEMKKNTKAVEEMTKGFEAAKAASTLEIKEDGSFTLNMVMGPEMKNETVGTSTLSEDGKTLYMTDSKTSKVDTLMVDQLDATTLKISGTQDGLKNWMTWTK